MSAQPFKPSSIAEHEFFVEDWCEHCIHDRGHRSDPESGDGCRIIADSFALDVGDAEYPKTLLIDKHGPRCTAFEPDEGQPTPRCKFTADMFDSTTTR